MYVCMYVESIVWCRESIISDTSVNLVKVIRKFKGEEASKGDVGIALRL